MYKKLIISIGLFLISISLFIYEQHIDENILLEQNEYSEFQKQLREIQNKKIKIYKSKLFSKISMDEFKKQIQKIKTPCRIIKMEIEGKNVEIILSSRNEKQILDFMKKMYRDTDGLFKFESIKIKKEKNKLKTQIKGQHLCLPYQKIEIRPQKISLPDSHFFKIQSNKKLFAIVNAKQALVNDKWYCVGNKIDDEEIIKIGYDFVQIKIDNEIREIHLGEKL